MNASASKSIRIVLADDHELVRFGIRSLLTQIERVEVIAEARDGAELVALLAGVRPDLVMTDLDMPGMDGVAAIAQIHVRYPELRIMVLSMHDKADVIRRAVANGAHGYLMKDAPPFELELAVRGVMATGKYFSPSITQKLLQPSQPTPEDELTHRQVEILKMLAQGLASKQIGFELGLSPKTIDVHRFHIMERLGLNDIASLTRYAMRNRLVSA